MAFPLCVAMKGSFSSWCTWFRLVYTELVMFYSGRILIRSYSAAEPAAVARFVEGAAGAAHRSKSSHLAQPLTGVDAMLTANLAAEVSPTI